MFFYAAGVCSQDTVGRDFVAMFLENTGSNPRLELHAASTVTTVTYVTITTPYGSANPFYTAVAIEPGNMQSVTLPNNLVLSGTAKGDTGLHIVATADISVYGLSRHSSSCGGYLTFPIESLGTHYFTVSWWPPSTNTQIGVVATEDDTAVSITFPVNRGISVLYDGVEYVGGMTLTLLLDAYQAIQIQDRANSDLTGTEISSSRPVAVFSGNVHTSLPDENLPVGDNLVEQMPPTNTWGQKFAVVPIPGATAGTTVEIVAKENNVVVTFNGAQTATLLYAGDYLVQDVNGYTYITSTKPIMVVQYSNSPASDGQDDDEPAMFIVPPVEQYKKEYLFLVPSGTTSAYLMLAIDDSQKTGLLLNNNPLDEVTWYSVSGTNPLIVGRFVVILPGRHVISHPTTPFAAYIYGITPDNCAFAYSAGHCMKSLTAVSTYTTKHPGPDSI